MRRGKNKGNILIDVTSLWDVVFIVLLVVMSLLQEKEGKIEEEQVNIQNRENALEALNEQYTDQLDSLNNLQDYVAFISVNARYDTDLVTRHIEVINSDKGSEIPAFSDLKRLSTDGIDELKEYIESYIDKDPDRIVVLSLNEGDEDILYRDEKAIKKVFEELSQKHNGNVRLK